jgi:hypothetical protein
LISANANLYTKVNIQVGWKVDGVLVTWRKADCYENRSETVICHPAHFSMPQNYLYGRPCAGLFQGMIEFIPAMPSRALFPATL